MVNPLPLGPKVSMSSVVNQSPPVDTSAPYAIEPLGNKHIVITGGASGFGAAFVEKWAATGASIVVADINEKKGQEVVDKMRLDAKNENIWFVKCDVTKWKEQVSFPRKDTQTRNHTS
jgi:NADP-dependent 3-hydroxy acid dehydrogenase YdfG